MPTKEWKRKQTKKEYDRRKRQTEQQAAEDGNMDNEQGAGEAMETEDPPKTPIMTTAPPFPSIRRTRKKLRSQLRQVRLRSHSPVIGDPSKALGERRKKDGRVPVRHVAIDSDNEHSDSTVIGSTNIPVSSSQMDLLQCTSTAVLGSSSIQDTPTQCQVKSALSDSIIFPPQGHIQDTCATMIEANDDGNCFFRSVIISLFGNDDDQRHHVLRHKTVETFARMAVELSNTTLEQMRALIESNLPPNKKMEDYNNSITKYAQEVTSVDKAFVGLAEAQAVAYLYQRPVIVLSTKRGRGIRKGTERATVFCVNMERKEHTVMNQNYDILWQKEEQPIVIWHNGVNHFNAVYKEFSPPVNQGQNAAVNGSSFKTPTIHKTQRSHNTSDLSPTTSAVHGSPSNTSNISTQNISIQATYDQSMNASTPRINLSSVHGDSETGQDDAVSISSEIVESFPVEFDQAQLEPPTIDGKKRCGRPSKKRGGCRIGSGRKSIKSSGVSARPLNETPEETIQKSESTRIMVPMSTPVSTNPRQVNLSKKHTDKIREHMKKLFAEYENRPWPREQSARKRRSSNANEWTRCSNKCDCTSFAECRQNAEAYLAVRKYVDVNGKHFAKLRTEEKEPLYKEMNLKKLNAAPTGRCHSLKSGEDFVGCAAISANHRVHYYDSGTFGDASCVHCGEALLLGEEKKYKNHKTLCCSDGDAHTEIMKNEFDELQQPPTELKNLIKNEEFLQNTMPLNNTFAFASVHAEKAPDEQLGSRLDTCKINGEISFCMYDIKAPTGKDGKPKAPLFAQVYTLQPEDAIKLRKSNFEKAMGKQISAKIIKELEKLIRQSPYGKTFVTAGDMLKEQEKNHGIEEFQIVLLTTREMKDDAIKNKQNVKIIEHADRPTAEQVAVIWVDEEGLAPKVSGFWIKDTAGKKRELKSGMPQLDPACFPLLCPKSTPGWRWFIKKKKYQYMSTSTQTAVLGSSTDQSAVFGDNSMLDIQDPPDDIVYDIVGGQIADDEVEDNEHDMDQEDAPRNSTNDVKIKSGPEKNLSERQFYRYRMALRGNSRNDFHWLWFARRLAEFFVISVLNRVERNEMEFLKEQQRKKNLRKILARDYINAIEKGLHKKFGGKLGQVFLMPQTFPGSARYYQEKYANLMTIVRNLGNPTWFVTFTGNPLWPEIQTALQDKQEWVHRADIVCRIFMDKAEEFIRDVVEKNVLGPVAGWCYSVEHQKRGMPHIHLLLILEKDHKISTPIHVNEYISARIPPLPPMEEHSPEAIQQRRLWYLVTNCMLHYCNKSCGGQNGPCKKHFPKAYSKQTVLSAERYAEYVRLDCDGDIVTSSTQPAVLGSAKSKNDIGPHNDPEHDTQIQYQRNVGTITKEIDWNKDGLCYFKRSRQNMAVLDDRSVIPYNPYLLLKYGCHINIEYVFGQKACKYLFKYILKGFEKAYVKVVQPGSKNDTYDYDEIAATFKVRYMTAMEAYLRLNSHKIVQMSHQIYTLSIHDEKGQTIVMEEGNEEENNRRINSDTRLTAFFKLCEQDDFAKTLRYDEIPLHYYWNQRQKMWMKRQKNRKSKFFVRIYTVSANKPELLAIRILLMNVKGPTSFKQLRTFEGITYQTFTEAAQKRGLLANDQLFYMALEDACAVYTGTKLHRYFAMLLYHGHPSNPKQIFEDFLDKLEPAPPVNAAENESRQPLSLDYRRNKVLKSLEYFFRCQNSTCRDMGIGQVPKDYNHEEYASMIESEQLEEDFYGDDTSRRKTPTQIALEQLKKLNEDQNAAFHIIKEALDDPSIPRLFFVEGAGGCGKTYFYNTLLKWLLAGKPSLDENTSAVLGSNQSSSAVLGSNIFNQRQPLRSSSFISAASTGIAALLLIGGSTVHRQFYVPNDVNKNTMPRINHESPDAQRFRDAEIIIIDEISMLDEKVFNYVDRFLREVCSNQQPFGGKVVVLGGDWKQLTPVVVGGGETEQIKASIKKDPLFKEFRTLKLTKNMRANPDQIKLCQWLLDIGNGIEELAAIPVANQAKSLEEIINFCFPPEVFEKPLEHSNKLCDAALLCPRNEDVFKINKNAIKQMEGRLVTSVSIDEPLQVDYMAGNQFNSFRSDCNLETIHNETPTGLPPHILQLKVGAPVMLIRNLDLGQGLCNGTRMQVTGIGEHNIKCKILTGARKGAQVLIPKIRFEYGTERNHRGSRFARIQYPLRLCFAMTVNKSQGQTLQKMGLILDGHQCFSHGQVYVAMSRVTSMQGIKVLSELDNGEMSILNIVYEELLDGVIKRKKVEKPTKEYQRSDQSSSDSDLQSIYDDYYNDDI